MHQQNNSKKLLVGALVGSLLLGGAATFFLATKPGKKLKRDLTNKFRRSRGRIEHLIDNLNDKVSQGKNVDWVRNAKKVIASLKDEVGAYADPENEDLRSGLLSGVVIGALLGAGGTMLVKSKNGAFNHNGTSIIDKIGSKAASLRNIISDVLELVETKAEKAASRIKEETSEESNTFDTVVGLASAGINLWQNIKNR